MAVTGTLSFGDITGLEFVSTTRDVKGIHTEQWRYSSISLTSALDGGGWSTPLPGRFTPGKDPVTIVQEAEGALGPVWTGAENLALTGIRSPNRQSVASRYTD